MIVYRKDLKTHDSLYIPVYQLKSLTNPSVLPHPKLTHSTSNLPKDSSIVKSLRLYDSQSLNFSSLELSSSDDSNSLEFSTETQA